MHAKNVGRAMFLDVAKHSNIFFDKQISNVGPTMFDRSGRALNVCPTRAIIDGPAIFTRNLALPFSPGITASVVPPRMKVLIRNIKNEVRLNRLHQVLPKPCPFLVHLTFQFFTRARAV